MVFQANHVAYGMYEQSLQTSWNNQDEHRKMQATKPNKTAPTPVFTACCDIQPGNVSDLF